LVALTTPHEASAVRNARSRAFTVMKKYFSHQNIVTFILVGLACATAIIVIVPLIRKFVPWAKKTATSATAAS
jgi:hypothetical protein